MDWPPSTPLLVNASGREPTPTDFLQYIQSLIDTGPLASSPSVHLPEGHATTPQYIDVVASLSDDFLSKFPKKGSGITPDRLQAATDLCMLSLEVLERVIVRVEGLFGQDGNNLHCMLMCRLLTCASRLDEWLESRVDSPLSALWKRVFEVVAVIFKTLGGDLMLGKSRSLAAWTAARTCFIECIGALKGETHAAALYLLNVHRPRYPTSFSSYFATKNEPLSNASCRSLQKRCLRIGALYLGFSTLSHGRSRKLRSNSLILISKPPFSARPISSTFTEYSYPVYPFGYNPKRSSSTLPERH